MHTMGPAVETGRLRAELNAFVRTKEQLENAILASEGSRQTNLQEVPSSSRPLDDPSSTANFASKDFTENDFSRELHQRKASGGFSILEPSSTDSSEASRGDYNEYSQNLRDGRDYAGTASLPANADGDGQLDAASGKEQQAVKPIGPPPYVASTKGSWGSYSVAVLNKGSEALAASSGPGGRNLSGLSAQIAGGDNEKAGGNLLSNWLIKQKAAGRLAKATAKEEAAPKVKHLTKLVEFARHNGTDAASILAMLAKRPLLTDKMVALKGLLLTHQLMQRGSPDALPACHGQLSLLQDVCKTYGRSPSGLGGGGGGTAAGPDAYQPLICAYSCMLTDKIRFHHRFSAFEGNYSVDFWPHADRGGVSGKAAEGAGDPLSLEALAGLQSILDRTLECIAACTAQIRRRSALAAGAGKQGAGAGGAAAAGQREVDPEGLLLSVVIPMLVEAELLHSVCCRTMELLSQAATRLHVPSKGLSAAREQLARQHRSVRAAFEEARNDPTLAAKSVKPPILPEEPSCLAPPPLICTGSIPRDWMWPDEAAEQPMAEELSTAADREGKGRPHERIAQNETTRGGGRDSEMERQSGELVVKTDKKPVIGGVGAAMEAALQRHAAGLEGQFRHRRGTGEAGSPGGSLDFDSSARSSRSGSPQQLHQYSTGTGVPAQTSPRGVSPLGQAPGQGVEPPALAMPSPRLGEGSGLVEWPAALPSPAMSPRPNLVAPQPPPPPLPQPQPLPPPLPQLLPQPLGVHQQLQQLHLQNLQMQEEGKRYLRQQHEQHQLQQQREWQQQQAQQKAVAAIEQSRFADLLANSPYKPEVFPAGTPLNQVGLNQPSAAAAAAAAASAAAAAAAAAMEERGQEEREQQGVGRAGGREAGAGPAKQDPLSSWNIGSMSDEAAWQRAGSTGAPTAHQRETTAASLPEWEIPYSELRLGQKIGQGAFGDVLLGTWQGTDVAVKRLQNMAAAQYAQASTDFRREVELVMKLRHPNVVLFMGACTAGAQGELCIVMEYARHGSLYHVLRDPLLRMDMGLVVRWALEAARGMNYLHTRSPAIVHRDLKSVNLLVDADWHIKVSDFGLARTKASSYAHSQVGTWGWMAPEVLDKQPYDEKADVYSFGVVLWELITREEPFQGLHPLQIIRAVDRGERPPLPASCPGPYRQLITDCWQTDASRRPSFDQIIGRLAAMEGPLQLQHAGAQVYPVR